MGIQMTQKHTPTPWNMGRDYESKDTCFISGGRQIIANLDGLDNKEANAAFIVRACNSHEALTETIQLAEQFLNSLPEGWLANTTGDIGALNDFYLKLEVLKKNAALAKAGAA